MRRAVTALLALLALAATLAACGDDSPDGTSGGSPAAVADRERDGATGPAPDAPSSSREAGAEENDAAGTEAAAGSRGTDPAAAVDLTVRPAGIRGARVTPSGAVQTLPPSEEAQRVAQANSYPSIKSFGEEAAGEEATNITFALVQYLNAAAADDWPTACARLYSPLRESLEHAEGGSCPDAYGELMSRVPASARAERAKIDVSSVRRGDGNRAFVIYKTPETLSADMPMYVEDGVWKVGALEAYVLTPGQAG